MTVQLFWPSSDFSHSQVSLVTPPSWSFNVAVSAEPTMGDCVDSVMLPGSSASVTVMVTAWVLSMVALVSVVPSAALPSVTWMVTLVSVVGLVV